MTTLSAYVRTFRQAAARSLAVTLVVALIAPSATLAQAEPRPKPARSREEAAARSAEVQRKKKAIRDKAAADKAAVKATVKGKPAAGNADKAQAQAPAAAPAAPAPAPATPAPAAPPGPAAPVRPGADELTGNLKPFDTGLPYEPTSPNEKVTFNLEDADLPDLVRMISQITGKRFILPSKGRSIKATVYAPTKVTVAEAYQAFLSILELNGMALVPSGKYLKIVESGRVEGRAIPLYTEGEGVPTGDRFLTHLRRVENISAEDAAALLERFKSGDGSITAYAPTNMLIVTDTGTNIQRMIRILEVIDVARTGEQMWVEPVHHADATELASRLTEIFEPMTPSGGKTSARAAAPAARPARGKADPAAAAGASTVGSRAGESRLTKILADERTNSLVILATERMYLRILEMLKFLDVSIEGEGRIHVHHLQHSDAEEMSSTLQALIGGKGGGGKAGAAKAAGDTGGAIFEGTVAITAHKATNALVITSSAHDYAALRTVIDRLDSERKQVFIEAVIMELSVDRNNKFGTAFHGGVPDLPTSESVSVLGFRAGQTLGGIQGMATNSDVLTGLALGVQGPQLTGLSLPGFGVAINALAGAGDANILSTPHLIATDNVEAEISVGQNVPLQTSVGLGGLGNLGGLAGLAGGQQGQQGLGGLGALAGLGGLGAMGGAVPRQDVGTTVTITPHINASAEIRLEIKQEISSAGAPSDSGGLGVVSIDRTRAKTEVVVRDQQTVVIGGLMRDQLTNSSTKVPVLGDIPLIGFLFRTTTKRKIKKNLLLFLTPYIIRSPADLRGIYERKMRERQEFLDRYFVFGDSTYEPPVDYSRTRGLLGEIMAELTLLDEQKQIMQDAAARPEQTHSPRAPVGQAPEETTEEGDMVIEPEQGGGEPAPEPAAMEAPPEPIQAPESQPGAEE